MVPHELVQCRVATKLQFEISVKCNKVNGNKIRNAYQNIIKET